MLAEATGICQRSGWCSGGMTPSHRYLKHINLFPPAVQCRVSMYWSVALKQTGGLVNVAWLMIYCYQFAANRRLLDFGPLSMQLHQVNVTTSLLTVSFSSCLISLKVSLLNDWDQHPRHFLLIFDCHPSIPPSIEDSKHRNPEGDGEARCCK